MEMSLFENSSVDKIQTSQSNTIECNIDVKSLEQRVRLLIIRDLENIGWNIKYEENKIEVYPPENYDKETIKRAMAVKRTEIINTNRQWINNNIELARRNLASGADVMCSEIDPIIEVCETQKQKDLFRIFRYYWSSPYSDYVGRRIKFLIRDNALPNKPVIGITALGSPIIIMPERDEFIGWDKKTRLKNLNYTMDAYVIGALPPYSYLLGGKLIALLLTSNEVRNFCLEKYKGKVTTDGRTANALVGIFTTSLYGKSSLYNRIKYYDDYIYNHIGYTKGY